MLLVLALTVITYAVFFLVPSNPACLAIACGPHSNTTDAQMTATEHRLGLDRPVLVQYGDFLWRLVRHGSLGYSYRSHASINQMLAQAVPVTASLVLGGAFLLVLLALPLGAASALWPHGLLDRGVLVVSLLGIALHPFVVALLLRSALADHLHIAPGLGYCPLLQQGAAATRPGDATLVLPCGGALQWAYHLYLPWLVFALFFLPMYTRMFRARVLQTLDERYVQVARAKGASDWRVLRGHVLRTATAPILPMLAMDVGTAITTAIYVETIFKLGGLGTHAVDALSGSEGGYDLPTIVAIVFVVALAVVVLNLAADIALIALDPRITGRSGRRSIWRTESGGLNRIRVGTATAVVAAVTAGTAFAAAHRPTGPPVTGAAGIARFTRNAIPVATRWSEYLSAASSWTAARQMHGKGSIRIRINHIAIGPRGWSIRASVRNQTATRLSLKVGVPLPGVPVDPGGAGFSLQFIDRKHRSSFGNITALPATAFQPELPPELAPGASWSGIFSGTKAPPKGTDVHVGIGDFRGPDDPYGWTLVTQRSFVAPALEHGRGRTRAARRR